MADDVDVASRDQVRAAFARLAPVLEKDDLLLVVLIGHATFDGVDAKFNLVGPDLEAADWKALVAPIRGKVVFVNTAAASAPFLSRLAGERRIVITATDSGVQRYETVFPRFFVQAFGEAETDLDKDARISVWEAFARASLGVRQYYRQKGQLTVEKPVLDDTGDGIGKDAGATGARRRHRQPHVLRRRRRSGPRRRPRAVRAGRPTQRARIRARRAEEAQGLHAARRVREAARRGDHRDRPRVAEDPHRAGRAIIS